MKSIFDNVSRESDAKEHRGEHVIQILPKFMAVSLQLKRFWN